jgi:hypothetical protein
MVSSQKPLLGDSSKHETSYLLVSHVFAKLDVRGTGFF